MSEHTTEDHNQKWGREAKELAASLVHPVAQAIKRGLPDGDEEDCLVAAKYAVDAVLAGLHPRFVQEAIDAGGADEMAYREAMGTLNLIEVMMGRQVTSDV